MDHIIFGPYISGPYILRPYILNRLSQLVKFQRIVEQDIKTELEKDIDNRQRMLPTHVIKLPDGTEVGDYIVLDFGGKFFRERMTIESGPLRPWSG